MGTKACIVPAKPPPWTLTAPEPPSIRLLMAMARFSGCDCGAAAEYKLEKFHCIAVPERLRFKGGSFAFCEEMCGTEQLTVGADLPQLGQLFVEFLLADLTEHLAAKLVGYVLHFA